MTRTILAAALWATASTLAPVAALAQGDAPLVDVAADTTEGTIMMTLPAPGADGVAARYIYIAQVETGLGSAAVGVDRGATLANGIVRFRRIGGKVAVEQVNNRFVATTGTPAEQQGVTDSFPTAVLWMGDIEETADDGSFRFDFAPFLSADRFGLARTLGNRDNPYTFAEDRSVADPSQVRVFPENAEFATLMSFTAARPVAELRNVSPNGPDVAMWVRHSLVALPDDPIPARHDPYGFVFGQETYDYSAPLGQPMMRRLALRHRLEKVDPSAARSPVKEPITFYIDPAAPEPVRQALADGVKWWADAFDAAGSSMPFAWKCCPKARTRWMRDTTS